MMKYIYYQLLLVTPVNVVLLILIDWLLFNVTITVYVSYSHDKMKF